MTKEIPDTHGPLVVSVACDQQGLFELGVTFEIFGLPRPEAGRDWYRFAIAAAEPELLTIGGLVIQGCELLSVVEAADIIIIPGWSDPNNPVPGYLIDLLRQAHARGVRIASICSGAFVLAAAGLLDGRRATTHWRLAKILQDAYPAVQVLPKVLYVDEGDVLTSAGSAAGIDLCLHIVRRDFGAAITNSVARRLVLPAYRGGGQAQYIDADAIVRENCRLTGLLESLSVRITETHTISSMAKEAGMTSRTFTRHFANATGATPGEWLLMKRLERARQMLERTTLPIEMVAGASGFADAAAMRHHFRSKIGTTPLSYRRQFSRS